MTSKPGTVTLRDRNCARDVCGSESKHEAAETMAAIRWVAFEEGRRAGIAEALAAVREHAFGLRIDRQGAVMRTVDAAERALRDEP